MARSNARLLRFAVFAIVLVCCGYILTKGSTYPPAGAMINDSVNNGGLAQNNEAKQGTENKPVVNGADDSKKEEVKEQPKEEVKEQPKEEVKEEPKEEPKEDVKEEVKEETKEEPKKEEPKAEAKKPQKDSNGLVDPNEGLVKEKGDKVSAVFVSLARNSDIDSMSKSIRQIEEHFNKNYHYDWVFLNDEDFNQKFKDEISKLVSGKALFGTIPKEHWSYPDWIDQEKAAYAREAMVQKNVIYGGSVSYRHMCRFESGFFFRHPLLEQYEYYWRVEPDIKIFCDVDYDVFKFMKDNDKMYGFTISLPEYKETIPTLWETTKNFLAEYPQYLDPDNNMGWISNDNGNTYNGCHFWSNFEVGSFKLWRLEAYLKYFEYLDKAGGFFYERWGDAPVHSIGASLFMPKDKIHFFDDIGYYHVPFHNCPVSEDIRSSKKCVCPTKDDFTWRGYSCTPRFFTEHGLRRPKGWENFT